MPDITYTDKDKNAQGQIQDMWRDVDANEVKSVVNQKQDKHVNLTSISAVVGNSGFLKKTDPGAFALDFQSENIDTAPAIIVLDMKTRSRVYFFGALLIAGARTWQVANDAPSLEFNFRFNINADQIQTLPDNFRMQAFVGEYTAASHQWSPLVAGNYEAIATYNGAIWNLRIYGPFI